MWSPAGEGPIIASPRKPRADDTDRAMIETIYILAKNEEANIGRCLDALSRLTMPIVVLDSGSQDDTLTIARSYPNVEVRDWDYHLADDPQISAVGSPPPSLPCPL